MSFFVVPLLAFVGVTAFGAITPSETHGDWMARGLITLKAKDKINGFKTIEEGFAQTVALDKKAQYAVLLSQAPESLLQRKRHLYAAFALEHSKDLTTQERSKLWTIVGDGYFDSGNVRAAQENYDRALKIPDITARDREYLIYKLGWTSLSLKLPQKAYSLWSEWLASSSTDEGLREDIVKTAARAWVESKQDSQIAAAIGPWTYLPLSDIEREAIASGMRQSLLRGSVNQGLPLFQGDSIADQSLRARALEQWYKHLKFNSNKPCENVSLLAEIVRLQKLGDLERKEARSILMLCVRQSLDSRKKPRNLEGFSSSELVSMVESLQPVGVEWWSLSDVFAKNGERSKACQALLRTIEFLWSQPTMQPDEDQPLMGALEHCDANNKEAWREVGRMVATIPRFRETVEREFRREDSKRVGLFARLWNVHECLDAWWSHHSKAGLYSSGNGELHPLYAWMSRSLAAGNQKMFLESEAMRPFVQMLPVSERLFHATQWRADPSGLIPWMRQWLDWKSTDSLDVLRLWTVLAVPGRQGDAGLSEQDQVDVWIRFANLLRGKVSGQAAAPASATATATATVKNRAFLAYGLLRVGKADLAWNHWDLLGETIANDPVLAENYLIPALQLAIQSTEVTPPYTDIYTSYVWFMAKRDHRDLVEPAVPSGLSKSSRLADLRIWLKIRVLSRRYESLALQISDRLERQILIEIEKLKSLRQIVLKHSWSDRWLALQGANRFGEARDLLASAIDRVQMDEVHARDQLQRVSAMIRQWEVGV